jgi:hypothetical protein
MNRPNSGWNVGTVPPVFLQTDQYGVMMSDSVIIRTHLAILEPQDHFLQVLGLGPELLGRLPDTRTTGLSFLHHS